MNKMFEKDARVLFIGDSIITGGRFVAKIFDYYNTNFPSLNVRIYNKGVPGDSAGGMLRRFVDDIMDTEATEVVLMAGMNDIYRDLYAEENPTEENLLRRENAKNSHCDNMVKLASLLSENGLPITLCSSTPYDEVSDIPAKNLRGCYAALCEIFKRDCENLKKYNLKNTVDFITPMKEIIDGLAERGEKSIVGADRVHPTQTGHEVMARLFLIDQGINVLHPTARSVIDGSVALPEYTEINAERFSYEQKLRSLAFVDYHLSWDRNAYHTIEEKIKFWEDNMDIKYPERSGYTYEQIKKYLVEKKNEPAYRKMLLSLTDKMVFGKD